MGNVLPVLKPEEYRSRMTTIDGSKLLVLKPNNNHFYKEIFLGN